MHVTLLLAPYARRGGRSNGEEGGRKRTQTLPFFSKVAEQLFIPLDVVVVVLVLPVFSASPQKLFSSPLSWPLLPLPSFSPPLPPLKSVYYVRKAAGDRRDGGGGGGEGGGARRHSLAAASVGGDELTQVLLLPPFAKRALLPAPSPFAVTETHHQTGHCPLPLSCPEHPLPTQKCCLEAYFSITPHSRPGPAAAAAEKGAGQSPEAPDGGRQQRGAEERHRLPSQRQESCREREEGEREGRGFPERGERGKGEGKRGGEQGKRKGKGCKGFKPR